MGIWGRSGGEGLELYPCLLPNFFDLDEVTEHFTQRPLATWLGGVMECGRSAWKSLRQKLPPSCLCHLSYLLIFSPFFSPFSLLSSFLPTYTHMHAHTYNTHAHPKADATCDVRFLTAKGMPPLQTPVLVGTIRGEPFCDPPDGGWGPENQSLIFPHNLQRSPLFGPE